MANEFNYGGQAVIEGVMMRGSRYMAVAVRAPDGHIELHTEALTSPIYTGRLGRLPFVRGLALLWDALGLGTKALIWSANVAMPDEEKGNSENPFESGSALGLIIFSLVLAVAFFFVLPLVIVHRLDRWITSDLVSNLVEGGIRLGILVGYIAAIGRMEDVKRVFAYHGAEHKTINAYEAGAPLTPASVRRFSLVHPRCGTGFLLVVVVVSVLLFAFLGRPSFLWRVTSRVLLIPVVAGVSYEIIRWSARHFHRRLVRWLIAPSLMLQRLTTREPTDDMLEVAIAALQTVLEREGQAVPADTVAQTV